MAGISQDISLQIKNNLNRKATFSLLGGTQDPSNGQANAKTLYDWDLTAETFANTNVLTIEAFTITNPTVITYEVVNQDGAITDLQTVVRLLNTLNLGVFNLDGNVVWILDDINIFGNISILISLSFDIDDFVEEAYNYFDPLNKTLLVDFSTNYKASIQQAVNTIPDFVDFVESQGWGLCYPINASSIQLLRVSAGTIFLVTDTGGVLSTLSYPSGVGFNNGGLDKCLLYAPDVNSFKTLQQLVFTAPLLATTDAYIYKYLFENLLFLNFNQNLVLDNGFQFLDPTYFPNPITPLVSDFVMPPFATNQLNLYGLEFPNLVLGDGADVRITSSNNSGIDLLNVNSEVIFDTMGQGTVLTLNKLIESVTNQFDVKFNSLTLIGDNQSIAITSTDASVQTINLDSDFNTKFNYGFSFSGNKLTIGCVAGGTGSIIQYDNSLTRLNLKFKTIDLEESFTTNLPPIGTDDGQIGFVDGLDYTLALDLSVQSPPLGFEMQYFNNWFLELGTQGFLSQTSAVTTGLFGTILTADFNTFVLSGQGISGYYALIDNGFTITTPFGAITNNRFSFTQSVGQELLIRSASGGQSVFETTTAIKGSAEVVDNSVNIFAGTETINLVAPVGNPRNGIITSDFSLSNSSTFIGTPFFVPNSMTSLLIGGGIFGQDLGTFTVSGLTITLPFYPATLNGDAYGLFKRDFSGLNGNNVNILEIREYNINTTDILNTLVEPFGSNALFNVGINGIIPSIPVIRFSNSNFGTTSIDTRLTPQPLEILLPIGATCTGGIQLQDCNFNFFFGTNTKFFINDNVDTQQALLGVSSIDNVNFDISTLNDEIQLFSNWNGVGNSILQLTIENCANLKKIILTNNATATPPVCSIILNNNGLLNAFSFDNHNLTSILVGTLPFVTIFSVNNNDLPSADLDAIIIALDNNGLTNGNLEYLNQASGTSPNVGVSGTAYTNLQAKSWTILGNVPI
jgi:hypothetical protein